MYEGERKKNAYAQINVIITGEVFAVEFQQQIIPIIKEARQ